MKDRIVRFLSDLDAALVPVAEGERLPLYMCDSELLDPEELGRRFESAMWPYVGERFRTDAEVNLRTIQQYLATGR